MLQALNPRWRPLFATAVYTGLRKGELCALRKEDIDLAAHVILVRRSWTRETPKGGRVGAVPIALDLAATKLVYEKSMVLVGVEVHRARRPYTTGDIGRWGEEPPRGRLRRAVS